jgi:gamma-glutamyltranspeptidase
LRLLEGFDLKSLGHLTADYIHLLAEAMKLAYADRDTYYGDPSFVDVPLRELIRSLHKPSQSTHRHEESLNGKATGRLVQDAANSETI